MDLMGLQAGMKCLEMQKTLQILLLKIFLMKHLVMLQICGVCFEMLLILMEIFLIGIHLA